MDGRRRPRPSGGWTLIGLVGLMIGVCAPWPPVARAGAGASGGAPASAMGPSRQGRRSPAVANATTRILSTSTDGVQGNGNSAAVNTSGNGDYVVFESNASNLVNNDTNGVSDIFLRDRTTNKTVRVSVATGGGQADGESHSAEVSPDGRYVVFESFADNLISNDTNGTYDVFLRDRTLGTTVRVSVSSSKQQGNGSSSDPCVSPDGSYVVFESNASNLVSSDTNGVTDVFLRDRNQGKTVRVSVSSSKQQGNGSSSDPCVSPDGRYVVFESLATNLISSDLNNSTDIFLRDRTAGKTVRVSVDSSEHEANSGSYSSVVSPDGQFVAFESFATNLIGSDTNGVSDVFLRDRTAGTTVRVSVSSGKDQGNGYSSDPSMSDDGQHIAFESAASNFYSGDTNGHVDVFVRDRSAGVTKVASIDDSGVIGNAASSDPSITSDGSYVVFESESSNLVSNDTNGHTDAFIHGAL
jgi:Tol biopolymer transport system component